MHLILSLNPADGLAVDTCVGLPVYENYDQRVRDAESELRVATLEKAADVLSILDIDSVADLATILSSLNGNSSGNGLNDNDIEINIGGNNANQ